MSIVDWGFGFVGLHINIDLKVRGRLIELDLMFTGTFRTRAFKIPYNEYFTFFYQLVFWKFWNTFYSPEAIKLLIILEHKQNKNRTELGITLHNI